MMKKRTILGIGAASIILAAIAAGTFRTQKINPYETAAPAIITQTQPTVEELLTEPSPEMVTLTEPEPSEIMAAEPLIESEQPVQETESKPIQTPDEPQEQPSQAPITLPKIPKEKPQPVPVQPQAPKNGDTKDGQIYIEGFGRVENHGGGAIGTTDDQMYQNGNKTGNFG